MDGPGNQLLSDNDWTYTYDSNGNLIQKVGKAAGPTKIWRGPTSTTCETK